MPRIRLSFLQSSLLVLTVGFLLPAPLRAAVADQYDRSNVPIEQQPTDPSLTKIVLVAGDPGTGHGPGGHEHFAGCALFMRMLQQTPGVFPVMVQDGWPKDPVATFKDAKAVVFYMNGGGEQTTTAHADEIDKLAAAGVGLVHVHQVIDYPADFAPHAAKWLGGAYNGKNGGSRGHWDASFDTFPESPVTRGVTPFKMNDGFILNITFDDALVKGVTPILRTRDPKAKAEKYSKPTDDVVCWTCERPDGGRSFVMTPGDQHKNWGLEGLRKLMINGILWTAKVEIPKDGAPVKLDPADLQQNMDRKTAKPILKVGKPASKKAE